MGKETMEFTMKNIFSLKLFFYIMIGLFYGGGDYTGPRN